MLALLFSIFLGALAFGAETGRCQYKKRKAQDAADVAAYAAGAQLRLGVKDESLLSAIARPVAEEGGYDGGDYAGNAAAAAPSLRANAAYLANPSLRIRTARKKCN